MQNVLLIVELILALVLIGMVLLQRSEGAGGLGMQGGNITGRSAQTPLGKVTWWVGLLFFAVAMALTIVEARESGNSSVLDRLGASAPAAEPVTPDLGTGTDLLPPTEQGAPATPPAGD